MDAQQQGFQEFLLDTGGKVRSLEGRYNLLRDRVLLINNNMVGEYKKVLGEMKLMNDELKDLKKELFNTKETMKHLITELERTARKEDFKLLEKYINLWNPMHFVSEADVLKIVEQALRDQKK